MIEIFLDLEPEIADAFEKLAQQKNCTPSEYISKFLIEYVEKHEKEPQR